jgi:hypothetical protein
MRPKVPKGYNPDYLHCRTFGHSWHVGNGESEGTAFYRFVLICDTCKTRRLEVVNRRTGSKASRRYGTRDWLVSSTGLSLSGG